MQRWCPDCGRLNSRWPQVLMGIAFFVLLMCWQFGRVSSYFWAFDLASGLAVLAFLVANIALAMGNDRKRDGGTASEEMDRRLT